MVTLLPLLATGLVLIFHLVWPMRHEGTCAGDGGSWGTGDGRDAKGDKLSSPLKLMCLTVRIMQQAKSHKAETGKEPYP